MDRATPTIETPASPENQCADVSSAVNSLHVDWLSTESGSTQEKRQQEKRTGPKMTRKRLTVYLPVALLDRLRDAVYWTQDLTLAGLIEKAVAETLDSMERQRGMPFSRRLEELKGGRPKRKRSAESGQPRSAA